MGAGVIRVLVVDDHAVVADALVAALGALTSVDVVGAPRTGAEAVEAASALQPDVALVDFRLPDISGADVVRRIRVASPGTACVVLTGSGMDRAMIESIDAGAVGFVTKDQRFAEVVDAVLAAADGRATFPADVLARILPALSRTADQAGRLTRRELDVLELVAAGAANAEIGARLSISTNTVRNHVANILTKTNTKTRGEAVAAAVRDGLITFAPGADPLIG